MTILRLAMPTPLRRSFDYLPPQDINHDDLAQLQPGCRVLAPFGPRKLVGVLLSIETESEVATNKLKAAAAILDQQPALTTPMLQLCRWAANYYQHPIGDVISNALPVLMRKSQPLPEQTDTYWQLTTEGKGLPEGALKRAPKQAKLLALLQQHGGLNSDDLAHHELSRSHVRSLIEKGLAESVERRRQTALSDDKATEQALALNNQQQAALDAIDLDAGYRCALLEGITGSGKTEVYLQLIERCLQQGKQALVLIPEIGLTPQTLARFRRRFNCPIAILHSALSDRERLTAWQNAQAGQAKIVIGTRSAVFTPMPDLGLIIIDEEHDSSFKQQDGFRYSARDVAIKRAFDQQCPIILGSATPSLETLHNAITGRYLHLMMTERATGASTPAFETIDIRNMAMQDGFSPPLIAAIDHEINAGNQVLVFINRRGFAPVMICHDCGFNAQCPQCDARLTVHFGRRQLRCHHCEGQWPLPNNCPECGSHQLDFRGSGTERSEQALQQLFVDTPVIRIDRDTTSRKNAMQELVDEVHRGEPCILVGTQMLAKGHHFPDVTLVAILDADGGLFCADFRGPEKMGQLLVQVAGRAGREAKPGRVLIQTHQPDHPLIQSLTQDSYQQYARQLLQEREQTGLPPYGYLTLLRAEHKQLEIAEQLLRDIRRQSEANHQGSNNQTVQCFGPLPAPMTKKAGQYRAQLLLQATDRRALNQRLQAICHFADHHPYGKKVRWTIDVDPSDMF